MALQQPLKLCERGCQAFFVAFKLEIFNILVRVIEHRVIVRADIGQRRIYPVHLSAYRAGELPRGVLGAFDGLSVDDIGHGLRRAQLHAPVQESALRKLARRRLPRAEREQLIQRRSKDCRRAVTLKLRRVLPGIAVRRVAYRAQAHIQQFARAVTQFAENQPAIRAFGHLFAAIREKEPVYHLKSFVSGEADYTNRGHLSPRRNGGNSVSHMNLLI